MSNVTSIEKTARGPNVITLPFHLGQDVRIKYIDCVGRIKAISIGHNGTQYQIDYFNDLKHAMEVWQHADQIEAV